VIGMAYFKDLMSRVEAVEIDSGDVVSITSLDALRDSILADMQQRDDLAKQMQMADEQLASIKARLARKQAALLSELQRLGVLPANQRD